MSNYKKVNQRMEDAVVSGYRALENGVVAALCDISSAHRLCCMLLV